MVSNAEILSPSGPRLRPPRNRVSSKAIVWWLLQAVVQSLVVVGAQVAWMRLADDSPSWLPVTITVTAVLGALYAAIMPLWRYRVHRWEITKDAVFTQSGWVNQEWRIAPVSRIQTVDTKRGPLQQLFGLATVVVTTASAAGPLHIAGLPYAQAQVLVGELTARTQATEGDAT